MYGQYHPLTKRPGLSKVVWGFTFPQIVAILIGGKLSWDLSKIVPALPVRNPVFAHIHHLIPLGALLALLYVKDQRTGLLMHQRIYLWIKFKLRQEKEYAWKR